MMSVVSSSTPGTSTPTDMRVESSELTRTDSKPRQKPMFTKLGEDPRMDSRDPVPIVELRPFLKKVWRREKSLPAFYEHYERMQLEKFMEAIPAPPSPTQEKLELYIGDLLKHKNDYPMSPRPRKKPHPTMAETKAPKQVEHTQSIVPGFITRKERSKSTLNEIQCSDAPTKVTTGLQHTLNRTELEKPPMINLNDGKLSKNGSRRSLQYFNPFRNMYHKNNAWSQGSGDSGFHHHIHSFTVPREADEGSRANTPFYDTFDRKGTLPSINISYKALKKRIPRERMGLDDSYEGPGTSPMHKVGGISNSLHVLSKVGAPTKVERQLSHQLTIDLRKFRKSRNYYFPFDMTPYELAKYYPPTAVNLTHGEMELRKGLQSNTSKRSKRTRERSFKSVTSAPDKLATTDTTLNTPREAVEFVEEDAEVIKITGYGELSGRSGPETESLGDENAQIENTQDVESRDEIIDGGESPTKRTRSSKRVRTTTLVTLIPVATSSHGGSPVSSVLLQHTDDTNDAAEQSQTTGVEVADQTEEHDEEANEESNVAKVNVGDLGEADNADMDGFDTSRTFLTSGNAKVRPAKVTEVKT